MTNLIVSTALVLFIVLFLIAFGCGRGTRDLGPSWFDLPREVNRAARRTQRDRTSR